MASTRGLRVVILSRSARSADSPAWGLGQDSKVLEQVLREMNAGGHTKIDSIDHIDPVSFYGSPRKPRVVDVQIHLEVPCSAAWKWAKVNIVVVNPEWWPNGAWDWVCRPKKEGGADFFVFKSAHARNLFPELDSSRVRVVAWRAGTMIQSVLNSLSPTSELITNGKFLYIVGGSVNKLAAAKQILRIWKQTWPQLKIIGTDAVVKELRILVGSANNIVLQETVETDNARILEQAQHSYHIVASVAEGFGYTFAEAAAVGAIPLWTGLPVYESQWGELLGNIGKIPVKENVEHGNYRLMPVSFSDEDIVRGVESILKLTPEEDKRIRGSLRHLAATRIKEFRHDWRNLMGTVAHRASKEPLPVLPPKPLAVSELPNVAVITLTRNRPRWFANMARNILLSEYPTNKLTWIIADDGDGMGRIDEAVMKFQSSNPQISVKYLSLTKALPIGAKRNRACDAAGADTDVFVMMDDDDHYPSVSIAARIAWLKATGAGCVYCSTIPMYDCSRYISAINVPPLDLSPAERVSEATLAFTRKFYSDCKFPAAVNVAEGEGFIDGRTQMTAEIPPEGIIVSFIHGKNATSRRVSAESEPNGCHYGFDDDYFRYISQLGDSSAV